MDGVRADTCPVETLEKAGKYLTFRVARQDFAMESALVRGILPMHQLKLSEGHEWICGFAALSGLDFPVVDLRVKLGIPHGPPGREPFVIVVESGDKLAGFIADRVTEVIELRARDFRNGVARTHGRARKVLRAEQVMSEEDWSALRLSFRV